MSNASIRFLVILAAFSMMGVIATQAYLTNKALESNEQQFNYNVQIALRNVAEGLCQINGNEMPSNDPIERVSSNYYIVRTNSRIDLPSLEYLLKAEFEKRALKEDFEYGVYDCQSNRIVFRDYIYFNKPNLNDTRLENNPVLSQYDYYFGVFFPNRNLKILWEMVGWKYTMLLTFIILMFFTYALFIILKQRRLSAIQRDFVNNITHEFKTPIATLKIASDVIADHSIIEQPIRLSNYARIIKDETIRLENHVNQILRNALLEEEKHTSLTKIDITGVIQDLIHQSKSTKPAHIDLIFNQNEHFWINGDRYLLEIVIGNLIENGFKYAKNIVRLDLKKENKHIVLLVMDNGNGIPIKYHRKVFEKFYRIPQGDQHNTKGFGLGLYVVKTLLKKMNARISIQSPGQGTVFQIKFQTT